MLTGALNPANTNTRSQLQSPYARTHTHIHTLALPSVSITPEPNQHANVPTLVSADSGTRGLSLRQSEGSGLLSAL